MAEMIPDRLPSGASAGEKKVFSALQALPDDCVVYYEPVVGQRYPDFVVIMPTIGLLIIEVKGWYPNSIQAATTHEVEISERGQTQKSKHPIRQARDYMYAIMDVARRHPSTSRLLHDSGAKNGRFVFPFGHMALLSNCSRQQLVDRSLIDIFPQSKVLTRDEFETFASLDGAEMVSRLKEFFDPCWTFPPLTEEQVNVLRAIIHPEIRISPNVASADDTEQLKVMDLRQERNARSLGEGHRVVYGVAGSGKTVILIARARLLAETREKNALILCYNKVLAKYFQRLFEATANVTCRHFHDWGGTQGIAFDRDEDDEAFGDRLLVRLDEGYGDARTYDAVFVDEAQDFSRSWFRCAKSALKEPDDGDLLVVGDGTQSLYKRRRFSWAEAGVNARGRTINKRFDLDRNYRNTRQILKLAASFVRAAEGASNPEDALPIVVADPNAAIRDGVLPEIINAGDQAQAVLKTIREWQQANVSISDMAILYRANWQQKVNALARELARKVPTNWLQAPATWPNQDVSGVTLCTMHSSKGLQWKAVIIVGADRMPFIPEPDLTPDQREESLRRERGLMYVALTRAEERLAIISPSLGGFAAELHELGQDL